MRRIVLILMMLGTLSVLPAQTLTEALQNLESSLAKLEQGYTLVSNGLTTLREQQTQLSAALDTLEKESTELERQQDSLEQSWREQKAATDALTAAFDSKMDSLQTELWVYRVGIGVVAGVAVWALIR